MSIEIFNKGIALGRERHTHISQRGLKWKNRNVPKYIRENMMVPFFITEKGSVSELWIIGFGTDGKVCFELFAVDKNEATTIYAGAKPEG